MSESRHRSSHSNQSQPAIDLSFRPPTYWPTGDVRLAVLANVQGEARRRWLQEALDSADPDLPPEALMAPVLDPMVRRSIGRIHPMLMGGEYLPPCLPTEIEIARVAMRSTTGDVISVRARRGGDGRIHYRVVDEYETEYTLPIQATDLPLTLEELVRVLDESSGTGEYIDVVGLVMPHLEANAGECAGSELSALRGFIRVDSDFYPDAGPLYEHRCDDLLTKMERQIEEDDKLD